MANPPRPERALAIKMYVDGHPYSEISAATGASRRYLYAMINREVRNGKLKSQRDPDKVLRGKIISNVHIGRLGHELSKLSNEEMITVTSKIKGDESLSKALIKLALRMRR